MRAEVYTVGETADERAAAVLVQLHRRTQDLAAAKQRRDTLAAAKAQADVTALTARSKVVKAGALTADMPSSFSLGFADIGESIARLLRNGAVIVAVGIGLLLAFQSGLFRKRR